MKRTIKLYQPEHHHDSDGTTIDRECVTVSPYGAGMINGKEIMVWADVDDDSMLYTYQVGLLWRYDGDLL